MIAESRPGRWIRAVLKTSWKLYEIRERPDGDYDYREIVKHGGQPAMKVSAGYVRAEFICEHQRRK